MPSILNGNTISSAVIISLTVGYCTGRVQPSCAFGAFVGSKYDQTSIAVVHFYSTNFLYRACLTTPHIITSLRLLEVPVLKVASLVQMRMTSIDVMDRSLKQNSYLKFETDFHLVEQSEKYSYVWSYVGSTIFMFTKLIGNKKD